MPKKNARLPGKKDVARALLLKGSVFVHLDPRRDGVVVPAEYRRQPQLVLQVGLDLPVPIPDLRVDRTGVRGTLSFQRSPFTCTVPWEAVFAVVGSDGRGMVWPTSMPKEIAVEVEREAERQKLIGVERAAGDGRDGRDGSGRAGHAQTTKRRTAARPAQAITTAHGAQRDGDTAQGLPWDENLPPRERHSHVRERDDVVGEPVRPFRVLPSSRPPAQVAVRGARPTRRSRVLPPYLRVVK
jgi:stringent starvation protein B